MPGSVEINFDGIIGPTHNFSGLSYGNIASMEHGMSVSNPKKAALQGLSKMHSLLSLGVQQAVLPPHERPFIPVLHALGFTGTDAEIIQKAWKTDRQLFAACSSAAPMWTANAATVSPSIDSKDKRVHFTPANLISQFHRSFEASSTGRILYRIFNHPAYFAHHHPLPYHPDFADEGAANHTRFCKSFDHPGVQLFVYGRSRSSKERSLLPKHYPARQTKEAAQAIVRLHRLPNQAAVFALQNPDAIDAGVFHNDVISVGHLNFFLYHEKAFFNSSETVTTLKETVEAICDAPLLCSEVKETDVTLAECIQTYLFNSQLITLPDQSIALIAPEECRQSLSVQSLFHKWQEDSSHPIKQIVYTDIRESMQNGGGPACLRLRVVLNATELKAMHPHVLLTQTLYERLVQWVEKHYRDRLTLDDLADPELLVEGRNALDELSEILQLDSIYSFQQMGPPPPLPELRS